MKPILPILPRLLTVASIGVIVGFFTFLLLPVLFLIFLQQWIVATREPVLCDGGEAQTPPAPLDQGRPLPAAIERYIDALTSDRSADA